MTTPVPREPGAAQAGGYVLALASVLVVIGLIFHPVPAGGFEERPSVLSRTPWWGPIHVAIAAGLTYLEARGPERLVPPGLAWSGLLVSILSWGRGIGSATGWYFLEPSSTPTCRRSSG